MLRSTSDAEPSPPRASRPPYRLLSRLLDASSFYVYHASHYYDDHFIESLLVPSSPFISVSVLIAPFCAPFHPSKLLPFLKQTLWSQGRVCYLQTRLLPILGNFQIFFLQIVLIWHFFLISLSGI